MIRPLTLVTMVAAMGAGMHVYQTKHEVALLDRELRAIGRQIEEQGERTLALRAEWARLTEPERLRQAAQRLLQLEAMAPTQFLRLADAERRMPAAGGYDGPAALFAPRDGAPGGMAGGAVAVADAAGAQAPRLVLMARLAPATAEEVRLAAMPAAARGVAPARPSAAEAAEAPRPAPAAPPVRPAVAEAPPSAPPVATPAAPPVATPAAPPVATPAAPPVATPAAPAAGTVVPALAASGVVATAAAATLATAAATATPAVAAPRPAPRPAPTRTAAAPRPVASPAADLPPVAGPTSVRPVVARAAPSPPEMPPAAPAFAAASGGTGSLLGASRPLLAPPVPFGSANAASLAGGPGAR